MRISDWSPDVCSSDLRQGNARASLHRLRAAVELARGHDRSAAPAADAAWRSAASRADHRAAAHPRAATATSRLIARGVRPRSDHDELWRFTMSKTRLAALAAAALSPVAAAAQTIDRKSGV